MSSVFDPHRCQALLCTKTGEAREVVTLSSSPFEATPLPAPMLSFSFPTSVEATPPTTDARLFFWGVEATPPNDFFLYLRLGSCDGRGRLPRPLLFCRVRLLLHTSSQKRPSAPPTSSSCPLNPLQHRQSDTATALHPAIVVSKIMPVAPTSHRARTDSSFGPNPVRATTDLVRGRDFLDRNPLFYVRRER